jgi:hypothetical protein
MGRQLAEVGQAYSDELEAVEAALLQVGPSGSADTATDPLVAVAAGAAAAAAEKATALGGPRRIGAC